MLGGGRSVTKHCARSFGKGVSSAAWGAVSHHVLDEDRPDQGSLRTARWVGSGIDGVGRIYGHGSMLMVRSNTSSAHFYQTMLHSNGSLSFSTPEPSSTRCIPVAPLAPSPWSDLRLFAVRCLLFAAAEFGTRQNPRSDDIKALLAPLHFSPSIVITV
jgi:hypothetical protein